MELKRFYLPILALSFMIAGCNNEKKKPLTAGILMENIDTTALPGISFHQYACGGWMKKHPLPDEYAYFGSLKMLTENNFEQLRGLIEDMKTAQHEEGNIGKKIGDLYAIAMNAAKLNEDGGQPIKEELAALGGLTEKEQIYAVIAEMHKKGITPYFALSVKADDKNSSVNITQIKQGGLGMYERNYYLDEDEATKTIREKYRLHIIKMFGLAGFDANYAREAEAAVMKIEHSLATVARSKTELRDPHANYNKMTVDGLKREFALFDWDAYLSSIGLAGIKEVNIGQPDAIREMSKLTGTLPLKEHIAYLQWNLISNAAPYLSDDFVNASFEFYGKAMTGSRTLRPRWKRTIETLNEKVGEAVGRLYVEKFFSPAAKERMITLVENLQAALKQRLLALDWMSDETKQEAIEKLNRIYMKIGYPNAWKDYSTLEIKNDSYWDNVKRAVVFETERMLAKVGKPVDKDDWRMNPQTVNAYYDRARNAICFPAGILQYPFFDMEADDAFNYGAIGMVIGHEIIHGFDDMGRQYDKDGNLKDWWTTADAGNFKKRANVLVDYFDKIEVAPDVYANGRLTLGENIADCGGLEVSFRAFKNAIASAPLEEKLGYTPEQRFFLAYATLWANNIRPAEVLRCTKEDTHSLGRWRVDAILPHIDSWYDAFRITEKDPMYLPPAERVRIW